MAGERAVYTGECHESAKWMGKLPAVRGWNTMRSAGASSAAPAGVVGGFRKYGVAAEARLGRHGRARPRARRRLLRAWSYARRSRHRQIAFAAGGGRAGRGRNRALRLRRGERGADQAARRPARRQERPRDPLRDRSRTRARRGGRRALQRAHRGLDPDDVLRGERGRAGEREPGARGDGAADALRQGDGRGRAHRGPRDQGRQHRGAARARAHRGHRALLRGRPARGLRLLRAGRTVSARPTRWACSRCATTACAR